MSATCTTADAFPATFEVAAHKACPDCGALFARPYARRCRKCQYRNLPGRHRRWVATPAQEVELRARYDGARGRIREIARDWKWTPTAVKTLAVRIGLARQVHRDKPPEWTATELAVLQEYAGARSVDWLSRRIRRTRTAVIVKFKRLGISRRVEATFSAQGVAGMLGVDPRTVRDWIERGWLRARRSTELRAGDDMRWEITDDAVRSFVRAHPMAFRINRVDQVWFLEVVMGGLGECR